MNLLGKKKWFTLIEMLIVIIIIGVLAAAMIPRMASARGRANDTSRRTQLNQIGTAILSYYFDNGKLPDCPAGYNLDGPCPISAISGVLVGAGLSDVPHDPKSDMSFAWFWQSNGIQSIVTSGDYQYIKIYKNGVKNNSFVLMAATETAWWSNWIINTPFVPTTVTGGRIDTSTWSDFSLINSSVCNGRDTPHTISFILNSASANLSTCTAGDTSNAMRYIVVY